MKDRFDTFNYGSKLYTTNLTTRSLFSKMSIRVFNKKTQSNFYPIRTSDASDRVVYLKLKMIGNSKRR